MNPPENLTLQFAEKTEDELLAMLAKPDDWIPQALDAARAELHRRGVQMEMIAQAEAAPELQPQPEQGRPVLITIICILGFIGLPFCVLFVFSDMAREIGPWYPPFFGFNTVAGLILTIGLWNMRRWAVFGDAALVAFTQITLLVSGHWNILSLLIPGISLAIQFAYLSRMK